ncbi:PLP-dependent aspartate aminotransferase family protein, partial [Amycolatopsis sp. WAC 04182]|uniref:trans-sulfuration enzyme family protein n=1 Tax=Amycolatopsis sp. WAC 04182 TaxID=2203198 RepID=UPI0018F6155F
FERSDGNAFFVEEIARSISEGCSTGLSESLRDLLLVRVEALPEGAQRVVRILAEGGSTVEYELLRAAVRLGEDDLIDALRAAVRPETRIVYLETISNPMALVADLPAMCATARALGVLSVVDNTFATPVLCRPLEHGADVVVHSTTKYLSGHSDVIGGIAVFADPELHGKVWHFATELGSAAEPLTSWLTLSGLQTLPLRMERHCANADFLATRLAAHPAVSAVHWPGLPSHPSYELAAKLLPAFGGVFSFDLAGGRAAGEAFMKSVRLALLAPSLGGVETRVMHPATT